jgi:hypothetical protein
MTEILPTWEAEIGSKFEASLENSLRESISPKITTANRLEVWLKW